VPVAGIQVQSHTHLVGIEIEKEAASLRMRIVLEERATHTGLIAMSWRFHLYYLGPQISQQSGTIRSRYKIVIFQYGYAPEGGIKHEDFLLALFLAL
jgi:hypothetical protein